MIDPKQARELRRLAEAAREATDMTPDEAFETLLQSIERMPNLLERTIKTLLDLQDKFPMPEWGWRRLVNDLRKMGKR
jgi:hypothetical protein